jgi:hypothetical protein
MTDRKTESHATHLFDVPEAVGVFESFEALQAA